MNKKNPNKKKHRLAASKNQAYSLGSALIPVNMVDDTTIKLSQRLPESCWKEVYDYLFGKVSEAAIDDQVPEEYYPDLIASMTRMIDSLSLGDLRKMLPKSMKHMINQAYANN